MLCLGGRIVVLVLALVALRSGPASAMDLLADGVRRLPSVVAMRPTGDRVSIFSDARSHDSFDWTRNRQATVGRSEATVFSRDDSSLWTELPDEGLLPARNGLLARAARGVLSDHAHYYSWPNVRDLAIGVAFASVLANTGLDDGHQTWYQREVRSDELDSVAAFWKTFGEGHLLIPSMAAVGLIGSLLPERPAMGALGEFGWRATRGYLVGAPPLLFSQYLTGGSRPGEIRDASHWRPLNDSNGVSGHAFMGAVPFLAAASMVESRMLKSALFACSTFTAWSRVNDDDHYLSQACLGWWMAYLACRAVDHTQRGPSRLALAPMITPELSGVAIVLRR